MKFLQIRLADDFIYADEIAEIERKYFPADEAFDRELILDDIMKDRYYIVESEDGMMGYFSVEKRKEILYIANILIIKKYRGKKYSKFILNHIEFIAKLNNIKIIGLHVFSKNIVAINLYMQSGYKTAMERIKPFYEDKESYYYEKIL